MSKNSDTALSVSSASFESHKFTHVDDKTLRISPTLGSLIFSLSFFLIGAGLVGFWAAVTFTDFTAENSVFLLLVGLFFGALGLFMYRSSNEYLIVNNEAGIVFVRSWWPSVQLNAKSLSRHISPQQIKAFQLVSRKMNYSSGNRRKSGKPHKRKTNKSYIQYQVNACTIDDERTNTFVTLKAEKANELGTLLANMFDVPVVSHLDNELKQEI